MSLTRLAQVHFGLIFLPPFFCHIPFAGLSCRKESGPRIQAFISQLDRTTLNRRQQREQRLSRCVNVYLTRVSQVVRAVFREVAAVGLGLASANCLRTSL